MLVFPLSNLLFNGNEAIMSRFYTFQFASSGSWWFYWIKN